MPWGKGHWEVGKESDTIYLDVAGKSDGVDNGSRTDVDKCASRDVTVLKVEVDVRLTTGEYAQTVVVDDERWTLLHNQTKDSSVPMYDTQFVVDEERLAYVIGLSGQNILHPLGVHQFWRVAHFC